MTKAILYTIAIFTVFAAVSIYILAQREDVSTKEGFLYSAVGCISVYKKLDQPEKVDQLLNLIHHFSTEQDIKEIQPGYITRFIKLIEKKWEKDNAVAQKNCSGILKMATGSRTEHSSHRGLGFPVKLRSSCYFLVVAGLWLGALVRTAKRG